MSKRFRKIKRVFKERCNINLNNHEVRQYLHALERKERYRRRYNLIMKRAVRKVIGNLFAQV